MTDTSSSSEPQIAKEEKPYFKPQVAFAKRGRRLLAYLIDTVVLLIMLGVLSRILFSYDQWPLLWAIIMLLWFALPESKLMKGQSFGKRLLKLRVINSNLQSPNFGTAIIRTAIFILPTVFPIIFGRYLIQFSPLWFVSSVFISSLSIATFYLFIFNKGTKQSLHDIVTHTYVVDENLKVFPTGNFWKWHLLMAAGISLIPALAFTTASFQSEFGRQSRVIMALAKDNPTVSFELYNKKYPLDQQPAANEAFIILNVQEAEYLNESIALNFIKSVIKEEPSFNKYEEISINLHFHNQAESPYKTESFVYRYLPEHSESSTSEKFRKN